MRRLGTTIAIVFALVVGAAAAYKLAFPTHTHRYRLTLEVETPDGLKSGSSIIEARARSQPKILPEVGSVLGLRGEAVFVDLGRGKNLVGLLAMGDKAENVDEPVRLAIDAFGNPRCQGAYCQWKLMANMSGSRNLPPALIPTLVTFADVNSPRSARVLRPEEFATVFGPGYRFKQASLELTDQPITRGLENELPFLRTHVRELTANRSMSVDDPYVPRMGQFRVGDD